MRGLLSIRALLAPLQNRPRPLSLGIALLTLSALYLALPARDIMNRATAIAILLHMGIGALLIIPAGIVVRRLYKRSIADAAGRRNLIITASLIASICALTGIYLALRAANGHSAARDTTVSTGHIVSGILVLLLAGWYRTLRGAQSPKIRLNNKTQKSALPLLSGLLMLSLFSQGALWGAAALLPDYQADDYYRDLTATNAEQAQNPLFPAGMRLRSADGTEPKSPVMWSLPTSESCGRTGCHREALYQWQASGHHFAGIDPIYQTVLQQTASKSGRQSAQWCQGCHAPNAVLSASNPAVQPGDADAQAREGVGCYSCHAAVGTPGRTGNGHFVLAEPQDYPFGNAVGWKRNLHDFLLRVRPGPHQRAYLKPELHASPEFCSSCHRQSFSVAQNHYQFVRGPDEFGEWQQSPFSGRNARSAGGNTPTRTCQDCHFPAQTANHFNHASLGGNNTLPALRGDVNRQSQTETYLREKISLDLFALHRLPGTDQSEQWIAPLDKPLAPYSLLPGETWTLDIVVTNRGVGHNFPAGYTDIKEAWLEVRLINPAGHTVLASGLLPDSAAGLPPDTHAYRSLGLDYTGKAIINHNLSDQVTMVYHRVIPSGGSDIARYSITLPRQLADQRSLSGPLRLSARLRYRSLRPDFARWALSDTRQRHGEKAGGFIPPITTLAETSLTLPMRRSSGEVNPLNALERTAASQRFVRYGSAMLLPIEKPDLSRALRAFHAANELAPDRAGPLLGMGRVFLMEPDLRLSANNFTTVLKKDTGSSAAAADLCIVYNKQGQHEQAIQTLSPLLARFPQDGKLQFDFGLALFKAGRYEQASEAFQRALAADPDDPAAHFQLKRCYEVMRKVTNARREDSITRYLAEDKLASQLIPRYLTSHSDARQSAQPFPIHALHPVNSQVSVK